MRDFRPRVGFVAFAALLGLALPTAGHAQSINQKLADLHLGIAGLAIDMPDGQHLGAAAARGRTPQTYRWDAVLTPDDRVSDDKLLGIEHFRWAGLPVVEGGEISFTDGIFGPERFRLGGRLTSLSIQGIERYEVRAHVTWSIYDTQSSSVIVEKEAKGLGKGATIGDRGEQPNALMDSVIDSLENFLDDEGEDAVEKAGG